MDSTLCNMFKRIRLEVKGIESRSNSPASGKSFFDVTDTLAFFVLVVKQLTQNNVEKHSPTTMPKTANKI